MRAILSYQIRIAIPYDEARWHGATSWCDLLVRPLGATSFIVHRQNVSVGNRQPK